jgi:DNA repair protein RadD
VPVIIPCPECNFENDFWGRVDDDGQVIEHFGRKCRGASQDQDTFKITACGYRFRLKICHACGAQNDITARECEQCKAVLIDADAKLKQARLSKNAHVMTPDKITFEERKDKNSNPYLEIRYYDLDAQYISEVHFFNNPSSIKKFNINFLRSHLKRPELAIDFKSPAEAIRFKSLYRLPAFIIARKQDKFWRITEKIFAEEL